MSHAEDVFVQGIVVPGPLLETVVNWIKANVETWVSEVEYRKRQETISQALVQAFGSKGGTLDYKQPDNSDAMMWASFGNVANSFANAAGSMSGKKAPSLLLDTLQGGEFGQMTSFYGMGDFHQILRENMTYEVWDATNDSKSSTADGLGVPIGVDDPIAADAGSPDGPENWRGARDSAAAGQTWGLLGSRRAGRIAEPGAGTDCCGPR